MNYSKNFEEPELGGQKAEICVADRHDRGNCLSHKTHETHRKHIEDHQWYQYLHWTAE